MNIEYDEQSIRTNLIGARGRRLGWSEELVWYDIERNILLVDLNFYFKWCIENGLIYIGKL